MYKKRLFNKFYKIFIRYHLLLPFKTDLFDNKKFKKVIFVLSINALHLYTMLGALT